MRLLLASDDGEILDSVDITREEWDGLSPMGAHLLLQNLQPGATAS